MGEKGEDNNTGMLVQKQLNRIILDATVIIAVLGFMGVLIGNNYFHGYFGKVNLEFLAGNLATTEYVNKAFSTALGLLIIPIFVAIFIRFFYTIKVGNAKRGKIIIYILLPAGILIFCLVGIWYKFHSLKITIGFFNIVIYAIAFSTFYLNLLPKLYSISIIVFFSIMLFYSTLESSLELGSHEADNIIKNSQKH